MRFSIRRTGFSSIELSLVVAILIMIACLIMLDGHEIPKRRAAHEAASPAPEVRPVELPPGWLLWEIEGFSENYLWVEVTAEDDPSIRSILVFDGDGWREMWRVTSRIPDQLP